MLNKSSFRVTLLLCMVLLFTAWNALRVWTALTWHDTLNEFSPHPAVWVIMGSGIFWVLTGILLLSGIWQRKVWAKKLLFWAVTGYTIWYWGERFIWQNSQQNWPFAVILNLVLFIFIFFTTKSPPREAHERTS